MSLSRIIHQALLLSLGGLLAACEGPGEPSPIGEVEQPIMKTDPGEGGGGGGGFSITVQKYWAGALTSSFYLAEYAPVHQRFECWTGCSSLAQAYTGPMTVEIVEG